MEKEVYLTASLDERSKVVLFWHFFQKCRGFVNQWKASLKWVAFFV